MNKILISNSFFEKEIDDLVTYFQEPIHFEMSNQELNRTFVTSVWYGFTSIKLWRTQLEDHVNCSGALAYLDEIASNFCQLLLLGMLGMKSPSFSIIRRSLENTISFLYYKDHFIELAKKEEDEKNRSLSISDMVKYVKDYPLTTLFEDEFTIKEVKGRVSEILGNWKILYSTLSNFVHASNINYLDLYHSIEQIKPDDAVVCQLNKYTNSLNSYYNSLFIIFFNKKYSNFLEEEKQIIRSSISENGYKKGLTHIFNEI